LFVDTTNGGDVDDSGDGPCSLIEAIHNANDDAATRDDCAAGSGNDSITFDNGLGTATITFTAAPPSVHDPDGDTLLIDGGGDITLEARGRMRCSSTAAPRLRSWFCRISPIPAAAARSSQARVR